MKKLNFVLGTIVVFSIFCLLTASTASAQLMDNAWLAMKVKAKGVTVNAGVVTKATFAASAYMHLTWDDIAGIYEYDLWTQSSPDNWEITYSGSFFTIGANENIVTDNEIVVNLGSAYIDAYHTSLFTIKKDAGGAFLSAALKSLGCEIFDGSLNGDNSFYGGCTMSGKTIDPVKLPFPLP